MDVTPATVSVEVGTTRRLTATPRDAEGAPLAGRRLAWSSANPLIAAVDTAGMVSGVAPGTVLITATSEGKAGTATIAVTPGPPSTLAFTVQPSDAAAGTPMVPGVQVTALDAFGNTATGFTGGVTIAIGAGASGVILSGTATRSAVAGVATFPDLSIDKVGSSFTLTAAAAGLPTATSAPFAVTAGAVSASLSSVEATLAALTASSGSSAATITVTARDQLGNPIAGATVVLAATGSGNTLVQPAGPTGASGVATGTLSSTVAETKTVSATVDGVAITQSAPVTVVPANASKLAFTGQPSDTIAGAPISPPVVVAAQDAFGNTIIGFGGDVTIAIGDNPGGGTLSGTTTQTTVDGVATFDDLRIDKVGTGYTLTASEAGLAAATTAPFAITAGAVSAGQSTLAATPATLAASNGTSAATITVTARDQLGNPIPGVAVVLTATGSGNTLTLPAGPTNASGVATGTFSSTSAGVKTVSATLDGVTIPETATVTIEHADASHLVFTKQPSDAAAGVSISPPAEVTARDAFGNTATRFAGEVTITIEGGPTGGTLSGTTTRTALAGVASFPDLSIDQAGTGYTLSATTIGLSSTTSARFSITTGTPSASQSTVQATPARLTASSGTSTATITVTVRDQFGNPVANATVILAATGSGNTLVQPAGPTDASGVALGILASTTVGPKIVSATVGAVAITQTATVTVEPGAASHVVFTGQPNDATAGAAITPAVQVTAVDAFGNTATGFAGDVDLAIGANPGGGHLAGALTQAAVAGVATFAGLSIDKAATGYTLTASVPGLTAATSAPFAVTAGAVSASQSSVETSPATLTASSGTSAATITVTARDQLGNPIGGATVVLATTGDGNTLTQPAGLADAAGIARGTLSSTLAGTKIVSATVNGVAITQTATVTVAPAIASQLAFTRQPSAAIAGAAISPSVEVTALDAFGNTVTAFDGSITVAVGSNPGGGSLSGTTTQVASTGVARFPDLSIDRAGAGYTLGASAAGLPGASSTAFAIIAGAVSASQSAVAAAPATLTASSGTSAATITVTARDRLGNPIAGATVALTATGSGNTLRQPAGPTTAAGVATATLSSTVVGTKTVSATVDGVALTQTAAVAVNPAATSQLVFTGQPRDATAGAAITPAVQVTAQDAFGNTATTFTGIVAVVIGTNPGHGTLAGTATQPAAAGVATFPGLSIDKAAPGYTLTATASALTGGTSAPFAITAGAVSGGQSAVEATPATLIASSGTSAATITVTARDQFGNPIAGATVVLTATGSGNTLTQPAGPTSAAGVATATLSSTVVGVKTVSATVNGAAITPTATVSVDPAAASQLAYTGQPNDALAGAVITPVVHVTAQDAFGNIATGFGGNVTIAIDANPGGGTLSGTATQAAVAGVATFGNLSVNKAGAGYTLRATAPGVTSGTSAAFAIAAGAVSAGQSSVSATPATLTASSGTSAATITVTARDQFGNPVPGVTVVLAATGGGNSLTQPAGPTNASGIASGTLSSTVTESKTVTATIAGLGITQTASVTVNPAAASRLFFTGQPSDTTAGATISPAVAVTARDAFGNLATGFSANVTIAIAANPGGGSLSGTRTLAAVTGVATFGNLSIDKAAPGYTLRATATGLASDTSAAFAITAGAVSASQSTLSAAPATITASSGASVATITVTARDQFGNPIANATVALAATGNGNTLTQPAGPTSVAGVATGTLSSTVVGTKIVSATVNGVAITQAPTVTVNPAAASRLAFTGEPSNAVAGAAITPAVLVTAQDALGNIATGFSGNVTIAIGANSGGGTLSGTRTRAASAGVATFGNLSIDKAATGYTLTASATGLTADTSAAFAIAGGAVSASQSTVAAAPDTLIASGGTSSATITVTARDQFGNPIAGATVVLAASGTANTLTQPAGPTSVAGVATGTVSSTVVGTRTVSATVNGVAITQTATVTVNPAAASRLAFTGQPSDANVSAAITPAVQVTAQDAFGNTVPGFGGAVTVAIGANPAGGILAGTTTRAASSGVAAFGDLSIDRVGTGYTLTASAPALSGATSAPFVIRAGAVSASQSTVSAEPTTVIASSGSSATTITVTARDQFGNLIAGATVVVAATGDGNTLVQPAGPTSAVGVATGTLSSTVAGMKTVSATVNGVAITQTATVTVAPAAASQLAFTVQPSGTIAGAAISPPIAVAVQDAFGNTITGFTGNVTIAIGVNPAGGTLTGTMTQAAVAGVATFSDLSIDRATAGYTLRATASGLAAATSAAFTISAGAVSASLSTLSAAPATLTASNGASAATITVTARDQFSNLIAGAVVVLAATGSGNTLIQPAGPTSASGVASGALSSIGAGMKTVSATVNGVAITQTATVTVNPDAATKLAFTGQPSDAAAGAPITPAVQVAAQDAFGNIVPGFSGSVTVTIGANPGGGTLSGTTTQAVVAGVASFGNLSIEKIGTGYTLTAMAGGLTGATSAGFRIVAGPVSAGLSSLSAAPATITASSGASAATVTVTARDAFGNPIAGATVVLAATGSGNTLTQPIGRANGVGVASGSLASTGAGAKTVSARINGVPITQIATVTVQPAAASQLAFTAQPSDVIAGASITPAVEVTAQDAFGNTATGFTTTVTVAIGTNPGGGTLGGTTSAATVASVATFANVAIDKTGVGYTLLASAPGLTGGVSAAFTIITGAVSASQSSVSAAPATLTASSGASAATITVTARDQLGNPIASATAVLAATGSGNTLTQPAGPTSGAGVATGTLSSTSAGAKTVSAVVNSVAITQTATVTVQSAAASQLAFTGQPSDAGVGATMTPAIQVTARDAFGNTATGFAGGVTVAIGANPGAGTLTGTTMRAALGGVATFGDLSINSAGTGYTLSASAAPLTGAASAGFNIVAGSVSASLSTVSASLMTLTASSGASAATITVTARDQAGNPIAGATVVLAATGSGNALVQPPGPTDAAGVATGSLSSIVAGTKTVTARIDGMPITQAATVTVNPAAASGLAFTEQPSAATAGAAISPPVTVTARDAFGNTATGFTGNVAVAIGTNPAGGTLAGTASRAAVAGVASFNGLSINKAGTGYTLTANAASMTGATSTPFTISPGAASASQSTVSAAPTTLTASTGASAATITVTARDQLGNPVPGATVVLAATGAGNSLAQPAGPTNPAGVATGSLSATAAGTRTVSARVNGLPITQTAVVTVNPAAASQLAFTGQPSDVAVDAVITPAVQVAARDSFGNTTASFAGNVTVASGANPTGAVLAGTTTRSAVLGVATFDNLSIDSAGAGYTLNAGATGLTGTTSASFAVIGPLVPVLVGAGDIANCGRSSDDSTARLLDDLPGIVYTLGDNAYPDGTASEFANCYHPTWGRHRDRTRPVPGNRDYNTSGASGYYDYFGAIANPMGGSGDTKGYYSYDVGTWHIIALNSEIATGTSSPQYQWLRQDLAGRRNQCVLAYWHKPVFASTNSSSAGQHFWRVLADSGAEVVLGGHAHIYERFAPMNASGGLDPQGVREFVVGTGGTSLQSFSGNPANSVVRNNDTHGVLRLTLYANSYQWDFVPAPGSGTFTDSGTATCNP